MAGKPGMKGGGGARPGAGRKKNPPVLLAASSKVDGASASSEPDSIRLLRQMTNDPSLDAKIRLDAAKALAPYEAQRKGEGGKKEERQSAAAKAAQGKYATPPPPLKLVAVRPKA